MTAIYLARWVLPITSAAIEYGAVAIQDATIAAVGGASEVTARFPDSHILDFGNSVILPGLVNAHSHLELTVMRGFLEREERDFSAWLKKLTRARLAMTPEDLFTSAMCGATEAARAGVTCFGDSCSSAAESMKALRRMGLRGIIYQESFGPDPALAHENMANLTEQIAALREQETSLVRAGVSPHAPYTVSPPQLELIAQLALNENLPVMMHTAESESERLFMFAGAGPFADGLRARGIEWQAPGISTVQHLQQRGILETKPLLAHCVTVDDRDIDLIGQSGASIAHCPRSNAKLGHGRAPFAKFLGANLKVGIGSDSVASNNNCDILHEARFAALLSRVSEPGQARAIEASATQVLYAATLGGARALSLDDRIGSLAEGMQADLIAVGLDGAHQQPAGDPVDALVFSSSGTDVRLTMVAGQEIFRDGKLSATDESELPARLNEVRSRINGVG
jgi:5-methylthioadenosine/S-adenosylhomocysteine deaminase